MTIDNWRRLGDLTFMLIFFTIIPLTPSFVNTIVVSAVNIEFDLSSHHTFCILLVLFKIDCCGAGDLLLLVRIIKKWKSKIC